MMAGSAYNISATAAADPRVQLAAQLLGCAPLDAFGRLMGLWLRCVELGTDRPEPMTVRACLGLEGERVLVAVELAERAVDGDLVVRDLSGRADWYRGGDPKRRAAAQVAGRARAAAAARDGRGRLSATSHQRTLGDAGPDDQRPPANAGQITSERWATLDESPANAGSSDQRSEIRSSLSPDPKPLLPEPPDPDPDPRTIAEAEREEQPLAQVIRLSAVPARSVDDRRRKLFVEAWTYAGLRHQELKAEGIDAHARNCWSGMPDASSPEVQALRARLDQLLMGDEPDFAAARETIRNRVDVAAAEARYVLRHLRFMTPMRMWDPKSFALAAALSPEQVRAQAEELAPPARAGPRRAAPDPIRRIKTLSD